MGIDTTVQTLADPADLAQRAALTAQDIVARDALVAKQIEAADPLRQATIEFQRDTIERQEALIQLLRDVGPPAELSPALRVWLAVVTASLKSQSDRMTAVEVANWTLAQARVLFPELQASYPQAVTASGE